MARYQTYLAGKKIIVVSRYAGKTVRGVAKCSPEDTYDIKKGEKLARLRCDEKISQKRVIKSQEAYNDAVAAFAKAQKHLQDMKDYMSDAANELNSVRAELQKLEAAL